MVDLHDALQYVGEVNLQINELAVAHVKYPAVHNQSAVLIGLLDSCCFNEPSSVIALSSSLCRR